MLYCIALVSLTLCISDRFIVSPLSKVISKNRFISGFSLYSCFCIIVTFLLPYPLIVSPVLSSSIAIGPLGVSIFSPSGIHPTCILAVATVVTPPSIPPIAPA